MLFAGALCSRCARGVREAMKEPKKRARDKNTSRTRPSGRVRVRDVSVPRVSQNLPNEVQRPISGRVEESLRVYGTDTSITRPDGGTYTTLG